eukprot:5404181-Pleurochrysis_carterae.AAC.1
MFRPNFDKLSIIPLFHPQHPISPPTRPADGAPSQPATTSSVRHTSRRSPTTCIARLQFLTDCKAATKTSKQSST